jgi:Ca-activated chloride channel homolog
MKLKAASASLAAVLTATLLMSLLPLAHADSAASQTQQGTSSSKPRRGKNGEPVTKSADNPDATQEQGSAQDSKPDTSKTAQPAQSSEQHPAASSDKTAQSSEQSTKTSAQQTGPQQERDAPPFDRPPIGAQGRSSVDSPDPARDGSRPAGRRPAYSGGGSSTRVDSRGQTSNRSQTSTSTGVQRDRIPESSTGADVDPEPTNRGGGRPPVLQRPADSRPRADGSSANDQRPPVLHRPTDPQPRDEGASPDISAGRRSPSGQQQERGAQQQPGDNDVIKLESTLINIPLLVSDRSGRYVPQLSARDFALYEDGVEQKIASFGTEEVPFSVVLLLDVSPSVSGSAKDIQDAAIAFVRQLREQDRVMVVSFDRNIHYLSDFTSDRRELESAIRRTDIGSGTSVYDAVYDTVQRKLRNIEGRKALILFSDGEDTTSSRASYDDAVNLVTESDVLVYGLRYPGNGGHAGGRGNPWPRSPIPGVRLPFPFPFPMPRRRGPFNLSGWAAAGNSATPSPDPQSWPRRRGGGGDFMADITAAGGGPVYDAQKVGDMSTLAHRIAEELRHVYVISYYPTNSLSNGGYRAVRVSVKGRDDIAVRHRRGYNAKPNGSGKPTI